MKTRSDSHTFSGGDAAFTRTSLYGSAAEHTYSGALSFMRRKYT
ncbi:MAG: agmatinase, partial [Gammaproteobacteria bacterium]|nr:agmatinase [Gammaproteobacteria bacterium]